ncbi:MAG TPA: prepilin-type N-terminal cleavage/methylation domain-containing protein [Terriglobales bacterium]|nr:prepilin-type N-terminal cleavage/methylation domain-containing protein [Terriglobales bacterium]
MQAVRRDSGFTLLELIVAISLTAVVLLILQTGLRLCEQAWRRGNDKVTALENRLAENDSIQAQVSSTVPRQITTQYQQRQLQLISFRGDAHEFRFLTNYASTGARSFGLWLASYRVAQLSDGTQQLFAMETGYSAQKQLVDFLMADQLTEERKRAFGAPANQIEISYFRPSSPGNPAAWVTEWKCDIMKQVPAGVRIHWIRGTDEQNLLMVIPVREEAK